MIEFHRRFDKPILIDTKLKLPGVEYPRWEVNGKDYWSKYHAIQAAIREGWEWPSFHHFGDDGFKRPSVDFKQASYNQCELISDTSKKVRHFYSGGRDSYHILECFLRTKTRLDEIVTYRRFPGTYDDYVNEVDRHNVLDRLVKLLKSYDRKIPVKVYDLMPEHFQYWSNNLETHYWPYTDMRFVAHHLQPLAEFYPELLDGEFTNIKGDAFPKMDLEDGSFYYIDGNFNWSAMDPYVCHFFSDSRNTDLAAAMAYHLYDNKIVDRYEGRESLGYFSDRSPLTDCSVSDIGTFLTYDEREWIWDMKDMRYHHNMIGSEIGRQSLKKFISFYQSIQRKYARFFENNSIWNGWVCSVTKKYKLYDV